MYHRTFEKIFEIIRSAGFNRIIHFKELGVNKSLINKNKKIFWSSARDSTSYIN